MDWDRREHWQFRGGTGREREGGSGCWGDKLQRSNLTRAELRLAGIIEERTCSKWTQDWTLSALIKMFHLILIVFAKLHWELSDCPIALHCHHSIEVNFIDLQLQHQSLNVSMLSNLETMSSFNYVLLLHQNWIEMSSVYITKAIVIWQYFLWSCCQLSYSTNFCHSIYV